MNKTILVIDDDSDIVQIVTDVLQGIDYHVVSLFDIEPAVEIATLTPDLVLLDYWLPGGSGMELCRELKSNPLTKSIPVILFTAQYDVAGKAGSCGADGWLEKPFDIEELEKLAASILSGA